MYELLPKFARDWLLANAWKYPNVIGFSEAVMPRIRSGQLTKREVIRFYVERKLDPFSLRYPKDVIPAWIGIRNKLRKSWFDTDVVQVGRVMGPQPIPSASLLDEKKWELSVDKTKNFRPVELGVSVGNEAITAGSLGMLYLLASGSSIASRPFDFRYRKILTTYDKVLAGSNAHVLTPNSTWTVDEVKHSKKINILQRGCYSDDTEILTENGWKLFKDLSRFERVMTLNPKTNKIEYQLPTEYFKYDYDGKMIWFKGLMYDILVSPEHNIFCKIWSTKMGRKTVRKHKWGLKTASKIKNYEIELKKDGIWDGVDKEYFNLPKVDGAKIISDIIPMEIWLDFFGWWLTEGSLKDNDYTILISQSKAKNSKYCDEIEKIITELGFTPYYNKASQQYCFYSKQFYYYLKQFGNSGHKFIPREIKQLSSLKLKRFLNVLFKGDGNFYKKRWNSYSSKSRRLIDDILELLIKVGLSGKIWYNGFWQLSVNHDYLTPRVTKKPQLIDYNGMIYDVTVPNHILMVRRNGNPVWSGNSYHGGRVPDDVVGSYLWHQPIHATGNIPSECPVGKGITWTLNNLYRALRRRTRFKAFVSLTNAIDFALYEPSVEHKVKIADDSINVRNPFIGHLFAGSDQVGVLCKISEILKARPDIKPISDNWLDPQVGDRVKGCSFWCNYETDITDVNATLNVGGYGGTSGVAIFQNCIMVNNAGVIRGGWSGSGWFKV
jgi:hypothetical protein